ncbi:unnamed protein product [Mytilus coruscus]|uniref:Uncharacterized protein n=1 Tax=Mytilus coruscus TaxID=42192 RepID=A0A6J8EHQ9_MYTCO|nr:unnamed protein product [Mytilus coruscus]
MVVPKERGDNVAPAAKRTVLRLKIGGDAGVRSRSKESPVATTSLSSEVVAMAPDTTTATSTETITQSESKLMRHQCDKGLTPINTIKSTKYLGDYTNIVDAQLLLQGFSFGFRLQYEGQRISTTAKKNDVCRNLEVQTICNVVGRGQTCSAYEARLFRTAFSLAFRGLFSVGELTVKKMSNTCSVNHTLNKNDVNTCRNYLEIHLVSSKTDQFGRGIPIHIPKQADKCIYPVVLLPCYLRDRPVVGGPLFCHFDGKTLTKYQFCAILKKSLHTLGIEHSPFSLVVSLI